MNYTKKERKKERKKDKKKGTDASKIETPQFYLLSKNLETLDFTQERRPSQIKQVR